MGYKVLGWGTAVFLSILFLVTACTSAEPEAVTPELETEEAIVVNLPDLGEAPEFRNDVWLNSDAPVTLADQRGKVVLLEFWTFG